MQIIGVANDATVTPFFSAGNKMPWSVSIHAESTVVTGVFEMRPVLEGSGRDADPCQRQTAGSVCLSEPTVALPELVACNEAWQL